MSGYSQTGTWIVLSGDRLIGPFDGRTPAHDFAKQLRREGFQAEPKRLWAPHQVREAVERTTKKSSPTPGLPAWKATSIINHMKESK